MPGRLRLLFVRHGETQDNIDKILQGHRDTSLTEKGVREAQVLGEKLEDQHIDAVYYSPLHRMVQTVEPILKTHPNIPTIRTDSDLKGQKLGELEGGSYDLVEFGNPRSADPKPGVEAFDDFVSRLKRSLGRIIVEEAPLVKDNDRVVIIATHGVCVTSIFKFLDNTPPCAGFNPQLAVRGPEAYEVRYTDSDDVAELVVERPTDLPITDGVLDWPRISGKPFFIESWGKRDKAEREGTL